MYSFVHNHKKIDVYSPETSEGALPVVILNSYTKNSSKIWEACEKLGVTDFILVAISGLEWGDEMTPWSCPPLYKGDSKCEGKADEYLTEMKNEIIPKISEHIDHDVSYFALAGYSLAGLFALYSGFKTNKFKRIMSASGSLWYPDFLDFVKTHELNKSIDKIYLSLGDKEKDTKIDEVKCVETNTQEIYKILKEHDIETVFELNIGGHFNNSTERIAKGIKWLIG